MFQKFKQSMRNTYMSLHMLREILEEKQKKHKQTLNDTWFKNSKKLKIKDTQKRF